MKDAFKVKKGLNVQPTDPADVVNPEAGDIIVDSTDDNRLKVYDPTSSEFAAVGTGGSSGNILSDIEKLTPTVSNVVAVTDTTTFLPIDDNNKSVKATFSGSDGTIRYEAPASADLDGVQGVVKVWIKTSLTNLSLVATKDGVAQNNGLTINSTNKWRQYEIPVVLGDADYGFEIQASGAVSGDVYIDEAFVKVEAVIRDLGAAHFVGKLVYGNANCSQTGSSLTFALFGTDSDCIPTNSDFGGLLKPSTDRIGVRIPNTRTDGYYVVTFYGLYSRLGAGGYCDFSMSTDGSKDTEQAVQYRDNDSVYGEVISYSKRFNSVSDVDIYPNYRLGAPSTSCRLYGDPTYISTMEVHFFPDSNSTIVSQNTELTAKTANDCAGIVNGGTGALISSNYSNCVASTRSATGVYTLDYTAMGLSNAPAIITKGRDGASFTEIDCQPRNDVILDNTTAQIRCSRIDTQADIDSSFSFNIIKQGADVNKSATIIGKFENINSSDLVKIKYKKSSVQVVASGNAVNALYDSLVYDNSGGAYNTTTGVFTPNKSSYYKICAAWLWDDAAWSTGKAMWFFIGDNIPQRTGIETTTTQYYNMNACNTVYYEKGVSYNPVRVQQNSTANRQNISDSSYNFITIDELPDTESIIKNLSNQKVECQTKKFTGVSYTGTGIISQLVFNNVDTSKYYSFHAKIQSDQTNSASTDKYVYMNLNGFETIVSNSNDRNGGDTTSWMVNQFNIPFTKPTSTTVSVSITAILNMQTQYGYATLCELPDTYVETTKF